MCSPSVLGQDSPWMAAKQNCKTSQKKKKEEENRKERCDCQTLVIYVISDTKNSHTAFQGFTLVPSKE